MPHFEVALKKAYKCTADLCTIPHLLCKVSMKCLDLGRVSLDQTITKESDDHHKEKVAGVHKVKINQGAVLLHVQSTPYAQVEKVHEPTIHLKKNRVY